MLIRDPHLLNDTECRYAMNTATHLDFLIYHRISKKPVLAIEVDGFHHHKQGTAQYDRDRMKDHILRLYGILLLRFPTNGSGEVEKIAQAQDAYAQMFDGCGNGVKRANRIGCAVGYREKPFSNGM